MTEVHPCGFGVGERGVQDVLCVVVDDEVLVVFLLHVNDVAHVNQF